MLFRTVYGAELTAIYAYISQQTTAQGGTTLAAVQGAFVVAAPDETRESQHVDDALSFLASAQLITFEAGYVGATNPSQDFRLSTLRNLRQLERGEIKPTHSLDPCYTYLLTELFIKTGRQYIRDIHTEANQLEPIRVAGGVSREKIQAWKRVMTYLGIGYRVFSGFLCVYSPDLLRDIIAEWRTDEDTLQRFIEQHMEQYIPTTTRAGDLAPSVTAALQQLASDGVIDLYALQDSPSKAYFGPHRYKGIRKQTAYA
jgi:hypothetical protein